jgi:hypothetical protein
MTFFLLFFFLLDSHVKKHNLLATYIVSTVTWYIIVYFEVSVIFFKSLLNTNT